ncbi:MAG: hypothetical protein ABI967_04220 [bacterium]
MGLRPPQRGPRSKSFLCCVLLSLLCAVSPATQLLAYGQETAVDPPPAAQAKKPADIFRLEKVPVAGGAELVTIFARLDGLNSKADEQWTPLVSVLRDTLGDIDPENDRLRYLWPLTYTRPTFGQRVAGAVPFLYSRVGNKKTASGKAPPPVLDLSQPEGEVWQKIFWTALQSILLDPYGAPVRASTHAYRRSITDYRKSHIARALAVLALYEAVKGPSAFSAAESAELQARLRLTDKTFGGLVDDIQLRPFYEKQLSTLRDERGHNWELLRQRAEAESLVFEPLQMPDGSATHALVWVTKTDLATKQSHPYSSRFLNIADPWSDKRLVNWKGFVETRYYDSDNRPVPADTPGAHPVELIPLALYGLDNPKIPMLLVDFRDALNPKKREMSRRVIEDVTRNVLALSRFGDLPFFLSRTVFDFVTGRRGMDINQPSRLRTYSQLKLLLALNQSLDPELRDLIDSRLEKVSLNPLENDLTAEAKLAQQQYEALVAYAQKPDGLSARLDRDRRRELVPLEHGKAAQVMFRLGNLLSFGRYTHREDMEPEMEARLDVSRRLAYHTRFLREVASTPRIEVVWKLDEVMRSLLYIAEHGEEANSAATSAAATIFLRTEDHETRRACLESLSSINTRKAKNELLRISQDKHLDPAGKELLGSFLNADKPSTDPLAASREKAGSN